VNRLLCDFAAGRGVDDRPVSVWLVLGWFEGGVWPWGRRVSLTDRRVHGLMEAGLQVAWNGLCQRVAQASGWAGSQPGTPPTGLDHAQTIGTLNNANI
jgi:hypothetical protein